MGDFNVIFTTGTKLAISELIQIIIGFSYPVVYQGAQLIKR